MGFDKLWILILDAAIWLFCAGFAASTALSAVLIFYSIRSFVRGWDPDEMKYDMMLCMIALIWMVFCLLATVMLAAAGLQIAGQI